MPALNECVEAAASLPPNPYHPFSTALVRLQGQLTSGCLSTSHVLIDLHRLVNDVLLTTASTFLSLPLPPPTPALSSLTPHPSLPQHLSTVLLQLRDANLLSLADDLHVRLTHSLTSYALTSSLHSTAVPRVLSLVAHLQQWVARLSAAYTSGMAADLSSFPLARDLSHTGAALSIIAHPTPPHLLPHSQRPTPPRLVRRRLGRPLPTPLEHLHPRPPEGRGRRHREGVRPRRRPPRQNRSGQGARPSPTR